MTETPESAATTPGHARDWLEAKVRSAVEAAKRCSNPQDPCPSCEAGVADAMKAADAYAADEVAARRDAAEDADGSLGDAEADEDGGRPGSARRLTAEQYAGAAASLRRRLPASDLDREPLPPVVVAVPSIMSGLVLRWYRNTGVARYSGAALVTASRSGVTLNGGSYLHDIPAAWITDAQRAVEMLQLGQADRAAEFATHKPGEAFRGELTEIQR